MKQDYPRPQKNDSWATDDWIQAMFPLSPSYAECAKDSRLWFDPCPLDDSLTRECMVGSNICQSTIFEPVTVG